MGEQVPPRHVDGRHVLKTEPPLHRTLSDSQPSVTGTVTRSSGVTWVWWERQLGRNLGRWLAR